MEIKRQTVNLRLKLGWCVERAEQVIPIPRNMVTEQKIPCKEFKYCTDMVLLKGKITKRQYRVWCTCGTPMLVLERELFYDLNCGCKSDGTTLKDLKVYEDMETNKEFAKYCEDHGVKLSYYWWCRFRHNIGAHDI